MERFNGILMEIFRLHHHSQASVSICYMNIIGPVSFYKCVKASLFTTPHKGFTNFALDAQREMDHRDAIKSFRSSGSIESILPRMSVIDDLQDIRKVRSSILKTSSNQPKVPINKATHNLCKAVSEKDMKLISMYTDNTK